MTGVYRHMKIGVLEIQRYHPPTFVKTLQNKSVGFHAELGNWYKWVESAQVEDGVEPTSALGSQEVMGIKSPWSRDRSTISTAPLVRRDETSSHSASHLHCSLGNWVSTGGKDNGGGLTKGREYPCLITSRTNWSEVIRCQAAPTGKRPFCAIPSCESHTRPGISRKVDPSPPPLQSGWDRRKWWGRAINGARLEASCWRPPAPWCLAEPETEQGPRQTFCCYLCFLTGTFWQLTSIPGRNWLSSWRGRRRGNSPTFLRLLRCSRSESSLSSAWTSRGQLPNLAQLLLTMGSLLDWGLKLSTKKRGAYKGEWTGEWP